VSHQSAATKTRINHYNYRTVLLSTTRHQNHTARRRDISASVSLWSVTLLLAANYLQSKLRRYTVQKKTNWTNARHPLVMKPRLWVPRPSGSKSINVI